MFPVFRTSSWRWRCRVWRRSWRRSSSSWTKHSECFPVQSGLLILLQIQHILLQMFSLINWFKVLMHNSVNVTLGTKGSASIDVDLNSKYVPELKGQFRYLTHWSPFLGDFYYQSGALLVIENIRGCSPEVGFILRRGFGGFSPKKMWKSGWWRLICNVVWEGKERPMVMSDSSGQTYWVGPCLR